MGVGDGWPCGDRGHASFLYRLDSAVLLVDAGEPVSGLIKKANWNVDEIDRVLITHLHMDHVGGIFMLLQGLWLDRRTKPLVIHMPAEGIDPVRKMLRTGYVFDELIGFGIEFVPIKPGEPIQVNQTVKVTAFPTSHLEGLKKRFGKPGGPGFEAFSFAIEFGSKRIIHSGDVGSINDLQPLVGPGVDVLVCEMAHVTLNELSAFVERWPIKKLVLVHLPGQMWSDLGQTRETAAKLLRNTTFVIPSDGEEVEI